MSEPLRDLIKEAFKNPKNGQVYSSGNWSAVFSGHTHNPDLTISFQGHPVFHADSAKRKISFPGDPGIDLLTLVPQLEEALPDYQFNLRLHLLIPVNFYEDWTQEIENATFEGTVEEYRTEYPEMAPGYDIASFSIPKLSDIGKVRITSEDPSEPTYLISNCDTQVKNDTLILYPTELIPEQQAKLPSLTTLLTNAESKRFALAKEPEDTHIFPTPYEPQYI